MADIEIILMHCSGALYEVFPIRGREFINVRYKWISMEMKLMFWIPSLETRLAKMALIFLFIHLDLQVGVLR